MIRSEAHVARSRTGTYRAELFEIHVDELSVTGERYDRTRRDYRDKESEVWRLVDHWIRERLVSAGFVYNRLRH